MPEATRDALVDVARTLHEAGWIEPAGAPEGVALHEAEEGRPDGPAREILEGREVEALLRALAQAPGDPPDSRSPLVAAVAKLARWRSRGLEVGPTRPRDPDSGPSPARR